MTLVNLYTVLTYFLQSSLDGDRPVLGWVDLDFEGGNS